MKNVFLIYFKIYFSGIEDKDCRKWNYVSRRICTLEGSSVNISVDYPEISEYTSKYISWYKTEIGGYKDAESKINNTGRVKYNDKMKGHHILMIDDLQESDSAEYTFKKKYSEKENVPGVMLVVTGNS